MFPDLSRYNNVKQGGGNYIACKKKMQPARQMAGRLHFNPNMLSFYMLRLNTMGKLIVVVSPSNDMGRMKVMASVASS